MMREFGGWREMSFYNVDVVQGTLARRAGEFISQTLWILGMIMVTVLIKVAIELWE